jgi:uncharacterized protein
MSFYFAADRTLGKLAKWLRILGFDTTFELDDPYDLFYEKIEKDRIVLTRTATIKKLYRDHKLVFITSNYLEAQLKQAITEIGFSQAETRPFSICIHCNVPIVSVDPDSICGQIPDYIYETHREFHRCPRCNRIFWQGSHTKRALKKMKHIFELDLNPK